MKATQLEKSLANLIAINQPAFIWGGVGIGIIISSRYSVRRNSNCVVEDPFHPVR